MKKYAVLLRGINVGGKNKVPMSELRKHLAKLGYSNVTTYIASGNVFLESAKDAKTIKTEIEKTLPRKFKLDNELIKVLVLTKQQLQTVVHNKPKGFGDNSEKYHSDIIFLIDISKDEAWGVFTPKPGVDKVWAGKGVVYSQRLSAERSKSRLGKIVGTPAYRSMTIRSWNTMLNLLKLINQ